jgi:VWFA-related protein
MPTSHRGHVPRHRRRDGARSPLAALAALLLTVPAAAQQPSPPAPPFQEHVEVQTVILEVRVLGRGNEPVRGLGRDDFRVTVAGRQEAVEAVTWRGSGDREQIADRLLAGEDVRTPAPPPRLIVLFYQVGDDRSRLLGQARIAHNMGDFIDSLRLDDRVAVVAFGSRLRVLLDFTDDRAALAEATKLTAIGTDVERPRRTGAPSLVEALDWQAAARAARPESGLLVTAQALEAIPGAKTMLLIGWGLGHFTRGAVVEDPDYQPARRALERAHTTVFALDVSDADSHSLDAGLRQVAEDTGGTYARTHQFPKVALGMLERALAGHYELAFARPDLPDGVYPVAVELTRQHGDVLCQGSLELRH